MLKSYDTQRIFSLALKKSSVKIMTLTKHSKKTKSLKHKRKHKQGKRYC